MYRYDTRSNKCDTLPWNGWMFPCIGCDAITSNYNTDIYNIDLITKKIIIPICTKCNSKKIKYIFDYYLIKNN